MGRAKIPPVRLVYTGLTGAERRHGSVCVTGLRAESSRENATPLWLDDEELGDGAGGGVGGGAEGGAARRGHALAVVWTEVCCTDVRRRSTRRKCLRHRVLGQAHFDFPSQAFQLPGKE